MTKGWLQIGWQCDYNWLCIGLQMTMTTKYKLTMMDYKWLQNTNDYDYRLTSWLQKCKWLQNTNDYKLATNDWDYKITNGLTTIHKWLQIDYNKNTNDYDYKITNDYKWLQKHKWLQIWPMTTKTQMNYKTQMTTKHKWLQYDYDYKLQMTTKTQMTTKHKWLQNTNDCNMTMTTKTQMTTKHKWLQIWLWLQKHNDYKLTTKTQWLQIWLWLQKHKWLQIDYKNTNDYKHKWLQIWLWLQKHKWLWWTTNNYNHKLTSWLQNTNDYKLAMMDYKLNWPQNDLWCYKWLQMDYQLQMMTTSCIDWIEVGYRKMVELSFEVRTNDLMFTSDFSAITYKFEPA